MFDDAFVIDAVVHAFNCDPSNEASGRYTKANTDGAYYNFQGLAAPGYGIPYEQFCRDWGVDELANMLFLENDADIGVYHTLSITCFKDGLSRFEKTLEVKRRWPNRFIGYAGVDPMKKDASQELARQAKLLEPVGLKLLPGSWGPDSVKCWTFEDRDVIFPIIEQARSLGFKVVAVHKAIPLGPSPFKAYNVQDMSIVADAFPDMKFEIVHAGLAFVEETAMLCDVYPNVYANLENTGYVGVWNPKLFARILATFITRGGQSALDKLLWATGASSGHPYAPTSKFWNEFEFSDQVMDLFGVRQLTKADKKKILGENYARMMGLDIESMKSAVKDDEFSRHRKAHGRAAPYSTTRSAGTAI